MSLVSTPNVGHLRRPVTPSTKGDPMIMRLDRLQAESGESQKAAKANANKA
jgi:hypothetical protein